MTADEIDPKAHLRPPEHDHYRVQTASHLREWLLESISSILALGLLIGIAIIFWHMDNKPLSAWTGRVSLNATLSTLTTTYTTALMHSVSTFISQFKWLHFKKGRRKVSHLQIFDRESRGVWGSILFVTTMPSNNATIGAYITILRLGFSSFTQQVVHIKQNESIPQDSGMQSPVHQGLFGFQSSKTFTCPGACRWTGSYISIGFRAECKNVTQATLETEPCGREHPDDPADAVNVCTLKTPTGLDLVYHQVLTSGPTTYTMNVNTLVPNSTFQDTSPELTRFASFRSSCDSYYNMYNTNVTGCSLFLTAYEYAGATANGDEFSFASRREVDFGVRGPWGFTSGNERLAGKVYTNETVHKGVGIPALWVDYHSLKALQNFSTSRTFVSEWWDRSIKILGRGCVWPNPGAVTALMGNVNIPERFDSMATAMTDYIRYGPNKQNANGETIQSVPYVLAILLAILSVVNNRRGRQVPLWKSSTLALLACQHEEPSDLLQTSGKDLLELEAESEMAQARLN
ncbi:DUF3176 domain-containing protein [Aspergillus foveolatus]|uniref:DUF3176 domain-containing protein n=1 Tax=Aspergillus foveolatus TaxID=210207 RepID=UPI003CCD457B